MTEKQADQIIDFMYGMHRPPDSQETRRAWRLQLRNLDPDLASKAAINGMQVWEFFPSWPSFYAEYRSLKRKVYAPDPTACGTCGGDKFVVVLTRPSDNPESPYDEVAPCPDCNSGANTSFRRHDGSEVVGLDPARVREMLSER
jgi:hypothetical protein